MEKEPEVFEKIVQSIVDERTLARSILARLHEIISNDYNGYGARAKIAEELRKLDD